MKARTDTDKDRWRDRHWDEGKWTDTDKDRWRNRHWDEGERTDTDRKTDGETDNQMKVNGQMERWNIYREWTNR